MSEENTPIDVASWLAHEHASQQPNDPAFMHPENLSETDAHRVAPEHHAPEYPIINIEDPGSRYPHMLDDSDDDSFDIHSHTRDEETHPSEPPSQSDAVE
jgi:hypothetical protein